MAVQQRKVDKFDKRLLNRRLESGQLTSEELQARVEGLPDLTDVLAVIETQFESSEEGESNEENGGDQE
ncbi:MAG: hypothetical protein AAFS10_01215 [Myxococcota bacterium]